MTIPLVDLAWQQAQIAEELRAGFDKVIGDTSFILGPQVDDFEHAFAEFCDVAHCIGVGSGTDALEFSLRALGVGSGDEVIVPANSFIASALAVLRAGAKVRLVDCEAETFLMSISDVAAMMGPKVKAVMPVHLFGQTVPVELLREAVGDIPVIEDAAQSQGATRRGRRAGSLGDVAATSFYPGKNIGAYGDAGAVMTNDPELAETLMNLRNWGSPRKYHHPELGFNSRLDTIQAVVLSAKLSRLEAWNEMRSKAAAAYDRLLAPFPEVRTPRVLEGNTHVWHMYVVRVPNRDAVLARLNEEGIGAGVHYPIPMHLQGALGFLGHGPGSFPNAEHAAKEMLSLPIFPGITASQQEAVVSALLAALDRSEA